MARFGFAIDNRVCIGCHACTVACKSEHLVPIGVNRTWVKYIEKGEFPHSRRSFNVQRCNHCDDAPCVVICPVTSLFERPDGIVDFDADRCIGCKACMQACPYDAIYLDPDTMTAAKCNYCTHRVDQGIEPACVVVCPTEAIVSGDLDDPNSRIAQLDRSQRVQYPKVEKGTRPKLFYVGGETAALDPTQAPPAIDYLWSQAPQNITPAALKAAEREAEQAPRARRVYDAPSKPAPWGWRVSAYVTTKALASGTVMISFLLFLLGRTDAALPPAAAIISLLFLGLTGYLLVVDLTQPSRFLYVLLRPQWKSWLVRGAYLITALPIMLLASAFASQSDASRNISLALGAITCTLAMLVAVYTAFLFAQARGRDYWQSPLLAITMLTDALASGVAVATIIGLAGWSGGLDEPAARIGLLVSLLLLAMLIAADLTTVHQNKNAMLAASMMVRGHTGRLFWGVVVGLGLAAPAIMMLLDFGHGWAAIGLLIGIAIKNHLVVQVPQRIPLS